jgi:hypothetical protein
VRLHEEAPPDGLKHGSVFAPILRPTLRARPAAKARESTLPSPYMRIKHALRDWACKQKSNGQGGGECVAEVWMINLFLVIKVYKKIIKY